MSLRTAGYLGLGLGALMALAGPVAAQPKPPRPAQLEALIDCRRIADATERLACFDRTAASLDEAETKGEVVVVDKGQIREARQAAFGFTFKMPSFMSGGEAEIENLTATVSEAYQNGEGKWIVTLDNGAVWRQIDSIRVPRKPKPGSTALVKTGMLGSFFMKIDGQVQIRVHRDR